MDYQTAILKIQNVLKEHQPRKLRIPEFIPAAVIIPFFSKNNEAHILFTLRTDTVEHHKGQVSFPGGAMEEQDDTLEETALRETFEEVGIPPEHIRIIGQLDDFPTISDFLVTPFVATIPYPYPFRPNHHEVAEVLEVPLELFLTDEHFEMQEREYDGKIYPVYFYHFQHTVIWGVTGFIINRFVELVFDYNPAPKSILADPRNEEYLLENIRRRGVKKRE
ncbi:MAG: CoA pyrophosphatase [Methanobacteriota archaeon]|nr:MAG: CoA pyrophosphatase [Euryarchaeota archaeon]